MTVKRFAGNAAARIVFFAIVSAGACAQTGISAIAAKTTIRWDVESVRSVITLDARKAGIALPTDRDEALRAFDTEMPSILKDAFFSILLDSSRRLGDAIETESIPLEGLFGVIDAGKRVPPYFSPDLRTVSTTHEVSLGDITSLFISHKNPYEPKPKLEATRSRPYTGILIDARGALPVHGEYVTDSLNPCLLPRVWNEDMDLVYEKNMVLPEIATKAGLAHYTAETDETSYRDRIGADPLRIVAREVFGQYRTDPVISRLDSLKILNIPENRALLRQGKVVILCDRAALDAIVAPVKDDRYYFVQGEIDATLRKKTVRRVDLTDTWEGLKLIMYDIRFVADTAKVLPEESTRIDAIAEALAQAGPLATFTVAGHTASVGKPAGELQLSLDRANKIADELARRGIDRARITAVGFGGTRPIADNGTEEGRAKNRRVEITIVLNPPEAAKSANN